jgi:hypothetical protein
MPTQPSKRLETFDNPHPARDYTIEIVMPEFTCLCPKTGQPDFATLYLDYVPDKKCVELKSLKLYIWSFRNEGHFHEDVTNRLLTDLVAATAPRYMQLRAEFYVRGGVFTTVTADYRMPGWTPPPPPPDLGPPVPSPDAPDESAAVTAEAKRRPAPNTTSGQAAGGSSRFRMLARQRQAEAPAEAAAPVAEKKPKAPAPAPRAAIHLGIDVGTTGCRIAAIDDQGQLLGQSQTPIPAPVTSGAQISQDPTLWWKAVTAALEQILKSIDPQRVTSIAVDGTSGTLLLTDAKGTPVTPALLYNDSRARDQADRLREVATGPTGVQGASSSLAKLLWLIDKGLAKKAAHALHQSDWISGLLTGQHGASDYNNCLKLGYDAAQNQWPSWMESLGVSALLPKVASPGASLGTVSADMAKQFGLRPDTQIKAGTTDGVASFLAAGAVTPGHAVTSLGTTLVLKLLSDKPVFAADFGVYSHRLGNHWLAGGASNSGGAVLLQYFKLEQLAELTPMLNPEKFTGLEYYPLPGIGERFPVNDPNMEPILEPLPGDSVTFLQGLMEGIAGIEAQGYHLLNELGAPTVTEVYTTGGGGQNPAWTRIRERILNVPMKKARSDLAAYGTALLAGGQHPLLKG